MGIGEIGPRLIQLAQTLASNPGTAIQDGLSSIAAAGQDAARQAKQAEAIVNQAIEQAKQAQKAAEESLAKAQADFNQLATTIASKTTELQAALTKATSDGQAALDSAKRQADQLRAAGKAADLAADEIAKIEQQADKVVADAQAAADKAVSDAQAAIDQFQQQMAAEQQRLQDEITDLTAQVAQLVAEVQQKTADAANQIAAEGQRLANDAQQLAADAAALPDKTMALAEDARHQLDSLVEQNASLIGLLSHALIFFKEQFFKSENRLQIATYTPEENAKPGIGLTWVDGQTKFLLAYAPELPGPNGSIVVQAAGANGSPVTIPASPVFLTITGAGDQETVISLDSGATPNGNADITISLTLGEAAHNWAATLGHVSPGTPTAEIHVQTKDGKWSYRASAKLQGVQVLLRLDAVLGPVANVVPIPEFKESRTFAVALEDGVFGYTEESAS